MRQTLTISEVSGFNKSPTSGVSVVDSHNFSGMGVALGDVVTNDSKGTSGTIVSSSTTGFVATISFDPGDFYRITLCSDYTVTNEFGPVYEFICKRCGKGWPRKQMVDGMCDECQDEPWPRTAK